MRVVNSISCSCRLELYEGRHFFQYANLLHQHHQTCSLYRSFAYHMHTWAANLYKHTFRLDSDGLCSTGTGCHVSQLLHESSSGADHVTLSPRELAEGNSQIANLLAHGHVEFSTSPYSSPILFMQKKDGALRICVDYCALSKRIVKNKYQPELMICWTNCRVQECCLHWI